MTEDMKSGGAAAGVTASNCRPSLSMQPAGGTMHSTPESLQPTAPNQAPLLPDTSSGSTSRLSRLNPKDMANSEFVNRLLAASRITDFYSANIAPHSFFYSEMLRSLVQARNTEAGEREVQQQQAVSAAYSNAAALPFPMASHRRNRKRAWPNRFSELRSGAEGGANDVVAQQSHSESDVKLTKIRKKEDRDGKSPPTTLAVATEKPPTGLIFPPNTHSSPWYPSYPPFFIDLRVSGHIYDNNNENKSTKDSPPSGGLDPKARQGSAFTVPPSSRNHHHHHAMAPMNLTTNNPEFSADKRILFKDRRYADDNNNAADSLSGPRDEEEDVKQHRSGYSKSRFDSEEVIAVVDEADA